MGRPSIRGTLLVYAEMNEARTAELQQLLASLH